MDVSIIVPVQASQTRWLPACLAGALAQHYDGGGIEVIVVHYPRAAAPEIVSFAGCDVRVLSVDRPTPYAARNMGASQASGDALLFTEPECVPDPDWVAAHVQRLREGKATVTVGHVVPARMTRPVGLLLSYEDARDEWVFSSSSWRHYFGRPKNMAVARRRFATHGPFAEVARGADSKLVQAVARDVACDEVALAPRAVVRQQSVHGLPSFLRDRFGHAHALRVHHSSHAAPIALPTRVALFRDVVRRHGYGPLQSAMLLGLLGAGILTFRAGGWAGAFSRTPRP